MFEQNYWSSQAAKRCKTLLWKSMGRISGKCPSCKQSITIFHQNPLQSFQCFFFLQTVEKWMFTMVFQSKKKTQHTNHQFAVGLLDQALSLRRGCFPSKWKQAKHTKKKLKHIGANQLRFVVYSVGVQDFFHQQYGVKTEKISLSFPSGTLSFTKTQASLVLRVA